MDWIEVNGTALRYDLSGEGPSTLVLVHEMGGTLNSWDEVAPALARRRRVLRMDLRGAGMSEKVRGRLDIDVLTADIAALLDALGVAAPVAIAGNAVGAAIAIRFAARRPERTRALIASSPACGVAAERRAGLLEYAERMEREGLRAVVETAMAAGYPEVLRTDPARFARFRARWLGTDPASFAAIYRMLVHLDMEADFARVACPTLVIAGTHDTLRPRALVEPVARAIRGARLIELPTGHYSAAQTPGAVAAAYEAFLAELGC
ncbi:alpha/beta fold hydrolase [Caldovatus aquaticus]|uniref:Alpha/beta hydrolase n=1 Tax=Caldovatus aquaticus TaxID=2865671 RepID=A0ABS7F1D7_9PROT|nr:alpha/beta hydrolase [Caldovatus aquaticus]MBW8269432.1 alpha/beta hydrolase [Caldovatus aquaticus]